MKLWVIFCFLVPTYGCAYKEVRSYDYCIVKDVTELKAGDTTTGWVAHCDGDINVLFQQAIRAGEGVYYSPYTENSDTTTLHGYIKSIEQVVQ